MSRQTTPQLIGCMEVWGGNSAVDQHVVLSGIEAWVYAEPFGRSGTGGDVHYLSSCGTGRITRLFVADVSGHGQAVSELSTQLRRLMRRHVNHITQNRFVESLNKRFGKMTDSGTFATAVVMTYFEPTRELLICNAGHPPPLLYRARDKTWNTLDLDSADKGIANLPLGVLSKSSYTQCALTLREGDFVLCYTDAFIEAKSAQGQLLGVHGLLDVVRGLDVQAADRVIPSLCDRLRKQHRDNLTQDDATIVCLQINPDRSQPRLARFFLSGWRFLRMLPAAALRRQPFPWPEATLRNLGGAVLSRFNKRITPDPSASRAKKP